MTMKSSACIGSSWSPSLSPKPWLPRNRGQCKVQALQISSATPHIGSEAVRQITSKLAASQELGNVQELATSLRSTVLERAPQGISLPDIQLEDVLPTMTKSVMDRIPQGISLPSVQFESVVPTFTKSVTSLLPSRYPSLEVSSGAISSLHESFGGIAEALAGSATLEPHWGSRAIAEAVNALAGSATSGFYESLGQIAALLPQA